MNDRFSVLKVQTLLVGYDHATIRCLISADNDAWCQMLLATNKLAMMRKIANSQQSVIHVHTCSCVRNNVVATMWW